MKNKHGTGAMKTATKVTPADHGRRMSLADFEFAEVQEGYVYGLSLTYSTIQNLCLSAGKGSGEGG
ncbi:MAG TPA: hypothetical protein VKJ47_08415 [Candidatus Binatia bacterium]|nr:hypothetical protein [Candidatus Binatia bacterium]